LSPNLWGTRNRIKALKTCITPSVPKWLSTTSNLVIQSHNLWNSHYVTIIVSITWHNSWNSLCQFYEDTIHEIMQVIQVLHKLLTTTCIQVAHKKSYSKLTLQNLHTIQR